jgi:serine/threonine-protein kinase
VQVLLPDFVGKWESDVVAQLRELGLQRGVIADARNDPAPAGTVIQQDPPPGRPVPQGSVVKILVSLGPAAPTAAPATPTVPPATPTTAPATVQLPNLTGQPFEAARVALEAAGFTVQRQEQPSPSVPAGSIISQTPPPGDVNRGATVTLVVSQGDLVTFPAVIGLDRAEAEARIQGTEGLNLVQVDEQGPDRLDNFENLRPNQVVSATANGEPVDNGALVPRGAQIVLGVRQP